MKMAGAHRVETVRCNACGRAGRDDDRHGDTCGAPLQKAFTPLTEAMFADVVRAQRTGVPLAASHPASPVRERCLGVLE